MSKIAGFWKSLQIQIAGFWKSFRISTERNFKSITWKHLIFVNNQLRRYCKPHIILFSKTNLKKKRLIKTFFLKNLQNEKRRDIMLPLCRHYVECTFRVNLGSSKF